MGQKYSQLTAGERNQFYALRKANIPMTEIAKQLNRSRTTLYNELARNAGGRGYRPKQAQEFARQRRADKVAPLKMAPDVIAYIEYKLRRQWSPEQIANYMKIDPDGPGITVSHETIYRFVWADKQAGGILYKELRQGHKKRRKRRGGKDLRGKIRNRVDIDKRPDVVETRSRIGDWEADLICGTGASGYLVTLLERVSRRVLIGYTKTKFADQVTDEILRMLIGEVVETVTFDNGKEFAGHERIAAKFDCQCFFAKPYHSWERGANENVNGLIRQYFPKKMLFDKITPVQIAHVQQRLNTRPRKCLGYKLPDAVYFDYAA
ncbi:MAG: IS30 family transposase [FCB group bacterium]|nr:IS30 family transposase [FCB group bacterium]